MPTRERRLQEEARRGAKGDGGFPKAGPPEDAPPGDPPDEEEDDTVAKDVEPMVWVRFTLPDTRVFTYYGTSYDRGQLFTLHGVPRDEQLLRMGFVSPVAKGEERLKTQCGVCGGWFLTEQFRDMHGELRHADRFQEARDLAIGGGMAGPDGGTALRDVTGDAEERRMQQQYPLYLDRTKATLESGPA
jgi:hypothetical protein